MVLVDSEPYYISLLRGKGRGGLCQREDGVLCPGWVLGIPKEGIREMIRVSNVSGSPGDSRNETLTLHIVSLAL